MKATKLWVTLLLAAGWILFHVAEGGLPPSPLLSITQVTDHSISFAIERYTERSF